MVECRVRVSTDGTRRYFLNGKLHREDGPAVEWVDGDKLWYLNGKLHRVEGAAVEYNNGIKLWYLNGERYTEEEFNKKTKALELTVKEIEELLGYNIKVIEE